MSQALTFRLIGRGISYSASPAMMNAAFEALGLPHRYVLSDVPAEDVAAIQGAGAVNILDGTAGMLSSAGDQLWNQEILSGSVPEDSDSLGIGLTAGDFNGDGFIDLAIGVFREDRDPLVDSGVVHVVYGSGGLGLTTTGEQYWHQDVAGVTGVVEANDRFGYALAAGDFDGAADLIE